MNNELYDKIANKYELKLLLLFGSQITGKTHKESDFDIAYLGKKILTIEDEGRLILDLMPALNVTDERLINLVNIKKASPLLFYAMTSKCKVLFAEDSLIFPTLRAYAFKKYIETGSLFKLKEMRLRKALLPD